MNRVKNPYTRILADTEISRITGIRRNYLNKIRRGKVNLENSKFKKYLENYRPRISHWEQVDDQPQEFYSQIKKKYGSEGISDSELSRITGVSNSCISKIRRGELKRGSNAKYLINYSCKKGYWEKIGDKKSPKKRNGYRPRNSRDKDKISDSEVARKTGVSATTVRQIRVGEYKNSNLIQYLANYVPNDDFWKEVDTQPIERYKPDNNPNKVTCIELAKRTGIHSRVLNYILKKEMEDPSKYFPYLTNYSCETGEWIQIKDNPTPYYPGDTSNEDKTIKRTTILDLVNKYCQLVPNEKGKLYSALVRRVIPEIGGPSPKSGRATKEEQKNGLLFLGTISAENAPNITIALSNSLDKSDISSNTKNAITSTIKQFVNHPQVKEIYKNTGAYNLREQWSKYSGAKTKHCKRPNHGIPKKSPYRLNAKDSFGNPVFDDYINDRLAQQLDDIRNYYTGKLSTATVDAIHDKILTMLGWLVRYKSVPLDSLCLENIVRFQKLNVDIADFPNINLQNAKKKRKAWDDYIFTKAINREQAFAIAREDIMLIEEYCNFTGNKASTAQTSLRVILKVAQYLYRREVSIYSEEYNSLSDVPVIKKILRLQSDLITVLKQF